MKNVKDLSVNDAVEEGVLLDLQRRYQSAILAGLVPFQNPDNARDIPFACLAITGLKERCSNLGNRRVCHPLRADQSVYPMEAIAALSLTRLPVFYLQRRWLPTGVKGRRAYRWNMLWQSFFTKDAKGTYQQGLLRLGGPDQPRPPQQRRADILPRQNLYNFAVDDWRAGETKRNLPAPVGGQLIHSISRTKDGRPWHFDIVIRRADRDGEELRDDVVYRFDADDVAPGLVKPLTEMQQVRSTKDGQESFLPREVKAGQPICTVYAPVHYVRRRFSPEKGYKIALTMRDTDKAKRERDYDTIRISDYPTDVETLLAMFPPMLEMAKRTPDDPQRAALVPVYEWAPVHMLGFAMAPELAAATLACLDDILSLGMRSAILAAVQNELLTDEDSLLSEKAKLWLLEHGPYVGSWNDLAVGAPEYVNEMARAVLSMGMILPGQCGYQGNSVLIPWELLSPKLRRASDEHYVFFPKWKEYFREDLGTWIAPPIFHRDWQQPPVPGTLPTADEANPKDWDDYEAQRLVAQQDSFAWSMHGIAWSFAPGWGTLDAKRLREASETSTTDLVPQLVS